MAINGIFSRFFPSKKKIAEGDMLETQAITLTPVYRKRIMTEDERRSYATELLDTYYGFGSCYLAGHITQSITNKNIQREMLKIVRSLPLLQFFTNSISRVYATQPSRKFYIDGKEIIKKPKENNKSKEDEEEMPFDASLNEDKFVFNNELYELLNELYNDSVTTSIKQSERFTNLLNTTIYKVVTNELGKIRLIFLPNDTAQVKPTTYDQSKAEQIAFVKDAVDSFSNNSVTVTILENWSKDKKTVPINEVDKERLGIEGDETENEANEEYKKLFGNKNTEYGFAPFAIFRNTGSSTDFWDQKDNDIVSYITSINMSLTELKYLEKFTSFGLKYGVNIKMPDDGVMDPNGFISFAVENNGLPGMEGTKNFEVGEFANSGSIEDVIKSIIFNLKMLFSMYNIPLDALVSTNSVRSAESKSMDNDELFANINGQREIWNKNEQDLFKVMQAVHNRDNKEKIPTGVEMTVDYQEQDGSEKTAEDWIAEIQNNVKTVIDWLAEQSPDLDRDELMDLLKSNKAINDSQKKNPLDINEFASVDEDGNLNIPEEPENKDNLSTNNKENDDDISN